MKQILISRHGNSSVLETIEKPLPKIEDNEVQIDVKAIGINFSDILIRKGLYPNTPELPCVVGYEVSGVVEHVGRNVDKKWVGQSVIALTPLSGYATKVVVAQQYVFPKPECLTFQEAASIPVVYLTAYQLLVVMGGLRKDESILIHNVGGGVGLAALNIALHIGAKTYGTSSPEKHTFLKKYGLHHAIDYRNFDWLQILNEKTHGKGVELVIDPIGGNHWKKSYRALCSTGRLGMFGISTVHGTSRIKRNLQAIKSIVRLPKFGPLSLMNSNKGVFGVNISILWNEIEKISTWMNTLLEGIHEGWLKPHVDCTFSFSKVAEAHDYIENRKNIGKVVLTI
ncbi:zinc-binding dehydrogenase [Candidatus Uabimicrobium amorphum]|nr:zinc-binding dehydrogenase [Candidatus Uabimicrobium amorphum]